jgi:competence protein ComEA
MELRPCLAALLLLVATWIPWGLSQLREAPPPSCADRERVALLDDRGARGALQVAACAGEVHPDVLVDEPRGAARLLLGGTIAVDGAPAEDLGALPGIGPGMARRIVAERERKGPFRTLDALERVRGLGAARIRALEGFAHAGPAPPGRGVPVQ